MRNALPCPLQPRGFARSIALAALTLVALGTPSRMSAQAVSPALESEPARPPAPGPGGRMLPGMPKFHEPLPYDIDEHTGYTQLFDGKTLSGWDGDPTLWRVEDGAMVGETKESDRKGNSYIVYTADKAKDFDLKLQMKIEKGGGGGIQYRSHTGEPWTRPQPEGAGPTGTPTRWLMTGPQADFWFPVRQSASNYTGQWYSENTMQGILAYRGQVTQALPGKGNRLVGNIGDKLALGGYVRTNEWNDYEIIARGGVMMHIMNGQLMSIFIDDDPSDANNQVGLIGFELESQPTKISIKDIWWRKFDR